MAKKLIKCTSLPSGNAHLPIPWKIGEKAFYLSDSDNPNNSDEFNAQFINLQRIPSGAKQNESRKHFKFL